MVDETEVIRQEMEGTRASLADKLEQLEHQVSEKVQAATSSVAETVHSVTNTVDSVKESVSGTVDAVKQSLDLEWHARQHPWMLVGGAFAVGLLGGHLLGGSRRRTDYGANEWYRRQALPPPPPESRVPVRSPSPPAEEGGVTQVLGDTVGQLKEMGIGAALAVLKNVVVGSVPVAIAPLLTDAFRKMTQKLGGREVDVGEFGKPDEHPHESRAVPHERFR